MAASVSDFQILRSRVAAYSAASWCALLAILPLPLMGFFAWVSVHDAGADEQFDLRLVLIVMLTLGVISALSLAWWTSKLWANALRYWLDGTTLRIDSGIFFLQRSAIPLDRVTDIKLVQGPLMSACGIWGLGIQTAGSGGEQPEAILYGLENPEQVRDLLIATRDAAAIRR